MKIVISLLLSLLVSLDASSQIAEGCYNSNSIAFCVIGDSISVRFKNPGGLVTFSYFVGICTIGKRKIHLLPSKFRFYDIAMSENGNDQGFNIRVLSQSNEPVQYLTVSGKCNGKVVGGVTSSFGSVNLTASECDKITDVAFESLEYGFPIHDDILPGMTVIKIKDIPHGISNSKLNVRKHICYESSGNLVLLRDPVSNVRATAVRVDSIKDFSAAKSWIFKLHP